MSKRAVQPDNYIQIDVKRVVDDTFVLCNMYTGVLCVEIVMKKSDYDYLIAKKFFLRDGKSKDSADILNTTTSYYPE
jgi:hypothetical protein